MFQDQLFVNEFNLTKQAYINQYHAMRFLRNWQLEPSQDSYIAISSNRNEQILKRYAGASFQCTWCQNQWYSRIHSSILFEYNSSSRKIKWRLFGQQCCRCQQDFHLPIYGQEAINETIRYLIEKLGQKIHHIDLRPRDPDRPIILHNGNRHREDDLTCFCEACELRRQYCEH
ncbi:unnamed protein product [Rotaria socialis]|uniref:3CxxC-type domain-containing protein n=1 Tax=Rotaria socialis TaxID=392032 RepID=A0A817R4M2_9BILA|nr:unnamed protein product [Rotaria socialis]CAF3477540.1 unnamed protein product [Rotaria socialis]CAF3548719.1 unnamed protein product [Rotaria socialis]CAF4329532.1 unnamed protein product [Rotaria socialis]CAF4393509.1 unnamed protein product [Rotaria socialis]